MKSTTAFAALLIAMMAGAPVMVSTANAQTDTTAEAPAVIVKVPDGYTMFETLAATGDEIKSADLYDSEGEKIASIEDVVIGPDSKVAEVLADVGGFLGIGAHRVALAPDQLQLYRNEAGDVRAYTVLSKDDLKALPKYEGAK